MAFLHALALVVAAASIAGAGVRGARALGARGLEVPVAAAPLAATLAGLEALALGLAGLGGSVVALTATAVVTGLLAWRRSPGPVAAPGWRALADAWRGLGRPAQVLLGALAGAALAWLAWLARHPGLGVDPLTYHLPESILWIQQGHPGSVETLQYDFPQGYYPVTNELLVGWVVAIARSSAASLAWVPAMTLLAVLAGWLGLRRLGADRLVSGLAIAAVLLSPIAASQLIGPHTDLPAAAWLWTAAALVAAAERRPRLLAAALLAAALAVGTKTTTAPLLVLLAAWALWRHRRARGLVPLVAIAALAGVAVGGLWYLRNLIVHGSPLWPFQATPFGDPRPALFDRVDFSFFDRPGTTLARNGESIRRTLGGALIVLGAGVLAPLVHRRRRALLAGAVALVAFATWANAPFTGVSDDPILDVSATTTRYLLPAIGAAAVALALAATGTRRLRIFAAMALAAACAWSIRETQHLDLVAMPSTTTLLAGAVLGAAVAAALRRLPDLGRAAAAAAAMLGVLALVGVGHGFARRQGAAPWLRSKGVVSWAAAQPAWQASGFPVAFAPQMLAPLAGDRLQHRIALVGAAEPCAQVRARALGGWVVLATFPFENLRAPFTARRCLATPPRGAAVLYRDESFTVVGPEMGDSTRAVVPGAVMAEPGVAGR